MLGRCWNCGLVWVWKRRSGYPKRLREARCPRCRSALRRTTHLWQGPYIALPFNAEL